MQVIHKSWNEFWSKYWRIDHRHRIPGIFKWDEQLADFIERTCGLKPGMRLLDLACGGGDQAIVFARRGYEVVGVEIAPPLVDYARDHFEREGLPGEFICGDMREIAYQAEFDAVLVLSGSFGFFGDEDDLALLCKMRRALKPGGVVFIMYVAPGRATERERTWEQVKEGIELNESWMDWDTMTMCSWIAIVQDDGTMLRPTPEPGFYNADERIRCYTAPEMRRMLADAGLEHLADYGRSMNAKPGPEEIRSIIVGRRPV